MKVILLQDVEKFGKIGEVKQVRNGYGFNYLLPEGLAELATKEALKRVEKMMAKRAQEIETTLADIKSQAALLNGKKVVIKTKAENEKLFGSVGRDEIATALEAMGITIDADVIVIKTPFRKTGVFPVEANFGHNVKAVFEITIEAE